MSKKKDSLICHFFMFQEIAEMWFADFASPDWWDLAWIVEGNILP